MRRIIERGWTDPVSAKSLGATAMREISAHLHRHLPPLTRFASGGPQSNREYGLNEMAIYDPARLKTMLGIEEGRDFYEPAPARTTEGEIWATFCAGILNDPRGHLRPVLVGSLRMARDLLVATSAMGNFSEVTGIIWRAVVQSARTRQPIRFPPILMVSPPGVGKSYYCRRVAQVLGTTSIPIAINGTSERGALGGLSQVWKGARAGRLARGLLVESTTASPIFLLDEIDKPPNIAGDNTLDVLLAALEPENARQFRDEYLDDLPIRLDQALWLASANDVQAIAEPLLSRLLAVDVPKPTRSQAALITRAIAADILRVNHLSGIENEAVLSLSDLSARRARQTLELAAAYAVCDGRRRIRLTDIQRSLRLTDRSSRSGIGFLAGQ